MKPIELVNKAHVTLMVHGHEDDVVAYACGKCRFVMSSKEEAEGHCKPRLCDDCGKEVSSSYRTICESCRTEHRKKKVESLVEQAKKVSWDDYDGPVYIEDEEGNCFTNTSCGEGFHSSPEGAADDLVDDWCNLKPPLDVFHVWGVAEIPFYISASDVIENELENSHHENAEVSGAAVKEFQDFLDKWCSEQEVVSYEADYTVLITGVQEAVKQRIEEEEKEREA